MVDQRPLRVAARGTDEPGGATSCDRSWRALREGLGGRVHVWTASGGAAGGRESRAALDSVLGAYLKRPPGEIVRASGGKPELAADDGLRFNLSHSAGLTLIAVAEGIEVGVDVERIGPRRDLVGLARRALPPEEAAAVEAAADEEREALFYAAWTRHEARLKCDGRGLGRGEAAAGIAVENIAVAAGWAAAVALAAAQVPPLRRFELEP